MLDNTRLRAELTHIHHALSSVAASPRGKSLVGDLRGAIGGTTAAILWQALFADCLRIAHSAVAADGEIGDDEIEALYELLFSAARHYAAVIPTQYGEFAAVDHESARAFLERYAADRGASGRGAALHWPGLTLCRRAAELGDSEALERYERMMTWLIAEACQVGGVTDADPRWRGRVDELDELRRTLARDAVVEAPGVDLRIQAFLTPTRVFTAVQQASSIFENDPFDVETIHREARASFEQMVERAMTPSQITDRGRMLLVLGDSGSGKTHLLRGFRRHVHEYGRGFIVYAQLQSGTDDYTRYLLQHLVDSLARPYAGPSGERTGLHELASGLPRLVGQPLKSRIDRLADETWETPASLTEYVNQLTDDLLREVDLASFDPDLLRVMLYALHPDQRTTSRVYKYLRCEDMSPYDRKWIGDVVPRTGDDHPHWMIRELGRLASVTQGAALVLMVDQADLAGFEAASNRMFRRAVDTLYRIVSEMPSAVAVVACLSDLYNAVRGELNRPALDRLEKDPPIARLQINRSYAEIEAIVARRLSWLFADQGTVHRPETPVYPIPEAQLRQLENRRTRDILEWCHQFQAQCAAAGKIVDSGEEDVISEPKPKNEADLDQIAAAWNDATHARGIDVPDEEDEILAVIGAAAKACADEVGLTLATPPRKNGTLRVQLSAGTECADLALSVTNRGYQRGSFAGQIEALRKGAGKATPIAVRTLEFPHGESSDQVIAQLLKAGGRRAYVDASALRTLVAFQRFQPAFPADRVTAWRQRDRPISTLPAMAEIFDLERLRAARPVEVVSAAANSSAETRSMSERPRVGGAPSASTVASETTPRSVQTSSAPISASEPTSRGTRAPSAPIAASEATLQGARVPNARMGDAEPTLQGSWTATRASEPTPRGAGASTAPTAASEPTRSGAGGSSAPSTASDPTPRSTRAHCGATATVESEPAPTAQLRVGVSTGFHAEPRMLEIGSLLRHTGILGSSGSGKTTLALNLIEQALERDIAVILLDRKGDLGGYANPDWWQRTADPERARRLAERIDVRLFTPGTRGGRPLSLPVVPDLTQVPDHERDRMVQHAANALAAMMRFGGGATDTARLAILTQAIAVLAGRPVLGGLVELIALVESRDDELVARAGRYDDRLFKRLVQDLETVRLSDADLFDPGAEPLTAETLIGRSAGGKVPLAIASTRFLGDVPRIQSWVAHLVGCLSRYAAKTPSSVLRTVFLLDEADLFMPAGAAKPPSKEPLQDLLKRARTAGLGLVLASQSPADFDYRSRELINTWFLGRIADQRSIDKMKPLFEHRPLIRGKLSLLEAGRFVMLQDGGAVDLERGPSLMRTEQLAEAELMALAARTNLRSPESARPPARANHLSPDLSPRSRV